jgi:phytoene desaturase
LQIPAKSSANSWNALFRIKKSPFAATKPCFFCLTAKKDHLKIAIIGAGVAGLAAALRMSSRGHEVEVFEANAYPGGKLSEFSLDAYRFDAGPSLFTMPQYVDELLELAGEKPLDHFQYERLPIVCHYFWEDGTRILAHADEQAFAQEVAEKLDLSPQVLQNILADSARKYELTGRIFLEKSLHRWSTWLNGKVAWAMLQIPRFDLFTSMNRVNVRLGQHPKLVQLLNRFATYNGSNPYRAPGLLTIIPHFEHHIGAFYPRGGMISITNALHQAAERKGAKFHFNSPVQEILVENGQAQGILLQGEKRFFDKVINNMDVFHAYRKLLPREKQPERTLKLEKSTSALIFYWGIKKEFAELGMHNIFFSKDYQHEFDCLSKGTICDDPTVYVNISSKLSPEDAPAGCENWFVMINAPYNRNQDWDQIIESTRQHTLDKLSRILGQNIRELITCEAILDPRSIESRTQSHLGALYGTSSNNRMAAFLRHPNFSQRIKNLFFVGGSVHPGGGIPLCLLSAKIVDEIIHEA